MGRDNLFRPCYGIRLHPAGAVFLRYYPGDGRIRHQSDDGGAGVRYRLLRRALRPGRGQVPGNGAYARQSAAFKPGSGYPGKPGEYRVPGDRGEGAGEPPHVPGQGAGRERGRGLSE